VGNQRIIDRSRPVGGFGFGVWHGPDLPL